MPDDFASAPASRDRSETATILRSSAPDATGAETVAAEPCSAGELACGLLGLALPRPWTDGRTAEAVVSLARAIRMPRDAWPQLAQYLVFDARQYRRVRLWRDETWEGLLLCWLPGQGTTIHDHGGAVGISIVLMGALTEIRFRRAGAGGALEVIGRQVTGTGEPTVELVETVHRMTNDTAFPAVSLHLYSPPLRTLGAYDELTGERWEVDVASAPAVQVGGNPLIEP